MRRFATLVGVLAVMLAASALAADPPGPVLPLNSTTTNDQSYLSLAGLPGGGFVAVWRSQNQFSGADGIVMRRFDAAGTPLGAEERVDSGDAAAEYLAVSAAPDGRYVVAWTSFAGVPVTEVLARAYNADGTPASGELPVNITTAGQQENPDVAMAPDGSFVVVWASDDGVAGKVLARRYEAGGAPASGEIDVGDAATDDSEPVVAIAGDRSFTVAWTKYSPGADVLVRGFTATNAPRHDAVDVEPGASAVQSRADITSFGAGAAVTWRDSLSSDIRLRAFAADGSALGAGFVTVPASPAGSHDDARVAAAADGSVSVLWDGPTALFIRRFDAALAPLSGDVVVTSANNRATWALAAQGSAMLAGFEDGDADGPGVYARRMPFDSLGGGDPPVIPPPVTPPAAPAPPVATPAPKPAAAALPALTKLAVLPSTKRCVSRRNFRIRLRHPTGLRIRSATVTLNGKRVATRSGKRVTAPVDLRGLPKGRFTVEIRVVLTDGRKVSGKRRYRTCAAKR